MAMRKFGRKKAHREWMLRNLASSVILFERVTTTEARAKEARRTIDHFITLGKSDTLADRRRLLGLVADRLAAKKIWEVLRSRYTNRSSGYTRLTRLGVRKGDNAPLFLIELMPDQTTAAINDKPLAIGGAVPAKDIIETKPERRGLSRLRKPKAAVTIRRKNEAKK